MQNQKEKLGHLKKFITDESFTPTALTKSHSFQFYICLHKNHKFLFIWTDLNRKKFILNGSVQMLRRIRRAWGTWPLKFRLNHTGFWKWHLINELLKSLFLLIFLRNQTLCSIESLSITFSPICPPVCKKDKKTSNPNCEILETPYF